MNILGLQGSPRKKGNTDYLLSLFLDEAERLGAATEKIYVSGLKLSPCLGCIHCEKKGRCALQDNNMTRQMYPKIRQADLIVIASPVYFYAMTGQLKLLIDRCQMFWSRKYRFDVHDPGSATKKGLMLSVAASGGRELFKGIELCVDYFLDAIGASSAGALTYRGIEHAGDMAAHPSAPLDVRKKVGELMAPWLTKKRVLFVDRDHGARSRMAEAFARFHLSESVDAAGCGTAPAITDDTDLERAMAEKKLDVAYHHPSSLQDALGVRPPDLVILMGQDVVLPSDITPPSSTRIWDLPDPSHMDTSQLVDLRNTIEEKVNLLGKSDIS